MIFRNGDGMKYNYRYPYFCSMLLSMLSVCIFCAAASASSFVGLGLTPAELMKKINDLAIQDGEQAPIKNVSKGKPDSPKYDVYGTEMIYDGLLIIMETSPGEKNIVQVTVIAQPIPRRENHMIRFFHYVMRVFSPELAPDERDEVLAILFEGPSRNIRDTQLHYVDVDHSMRYMFLQNNGLVFYFSARNLRDI